MPESELFPGRYLLYDPSSLEKAAKDAFPVFVGEVNGFEVRILDNDPYYNALFVKNGRPVLLEQSVANYEAYLNQLSADQKFLDHLLQQ